MCVILPQITQRSQRNAAGLHYFAEKDRLGMVNAVLRFVVLGFIVLGFVCVNQRNLREIYWGFFVQLIKYSCVFILPQMAQRSQRECSRAALFRRERQVGLVYTVLRSLRFVV